MAQDIPHTASGRRVFMVNLNKYDQPYPVYPTGLAQIDGALCKRGFECRIWDHWASKDSLEDCLDSFRPDFVGVSLRNIDNIQFHNPHSFVKDLLECCATVRKRTRAPLIIGGSGFSVFPRELMEFTGADFGIQGEGEDSLVRLLEALASGGQTAIPGVLARGPAGEKCRGMALADRGTFSVSPRHDPAILNAYVSRGGIPGVQTQRGCALKCCYCTYPVIEGCGARYRSPDEIVEELRDMYEKGVRYVFIVDSVFNTSRSHVGSVCESIARAGLDLQWECFLKPAGVDDELLTLMKRAGMRHIEYGSDSFSDPVLKAYGKSFNYEQIERASRSAHALGINYSHFLIFGGPGETNETVQETLERARNLPGAFYFATIGMRVYPGTHLWKMLDPESRGETAMDYLIEPRFHLAEGLTMEGLYGTLRTMQRSCHNWVVGDPSPAFVGTMEKLRKRGIRGPMWEYVELLQRYSFGDDPGAAEPQPGQG